MKTILYIHQYFRTPKDGGALRSYFISQGLIENGCQVQMITTHNQKEYQQKKIDRIHVHYLPVNYSNKMSSGRRYFAFIKFVFLAIRLIPKLPKYDLVFATSTPLTVGIIPLWVKWRKKIPYIFEVRDLWPEAPIQLGVMKNRQLITISRKLEKTIYKHADTIIALSPGIQSGISIVWPSSKIKMIPNMSDIQFFNDPDNSKIPDKIFTIGYFGAFGFANDTEFIIKIAKACQHKNLHVKFVLAGEGARKEFLQESIHELQLDNIELLPQQNRFEVRELMKTVDACLTTFLDSPVLRSNSPNKFFDGLAAGKLCIVSTKGWLKELVEENKCGIYIAPDNPDHFPDQIKPFVDKKTLLTEYQQNARILAIKEFSREYLVTKICQEVSETLLNI